MNENELNDIFENDSCPNCERLSAYSIIATFILVFIFFVQFTYCFITMHHYSSYSSLESICNQQYDTQSCSVVFKNDDVVLFDTYNGYVTMENILK